MKEYSGQKIFEKIVTYADLANKSIFEIGCGDGRISSLLATETDSLISIDPDETKIQQAKTHIAGVNFRIGTGEKLNFSNNIFDIVIFTLSLHHQNSQKAIAEANRVLKPGGKILIIEPVIGGEIEDLFAFLDNENNEKREAQKAIIDSGLSIVDSEIFTAEWVFTDIDDLLHSVFQYYNTPYKPDIALEITHFIGMKSQTRPIRLLDKMSIQCLID